MGAGREVLDSSPWIGSTPEGGALIQSSILCYLSSYTSSEARGPRHDHYTTITTVHHDHQVFRRTRAGLIPCGVDGLEGHDVGSDVD